MPHHDRQKALPWVERLLFLLAAVLLGTYIYFRLETAYWQWSQGNTLEENGVAAIPRNGIMGRITIPRLNISALILHGVDERSLRLAVGHLPGTALPGSPGHVALAAHRDGFFRPLRRIRAGDLIQLKTRNGTRSYRVGKTWVTNAEDTMLLRDCAREDCLTLITCYPFDFVGPAPDRFIVRARPEERGAAADSDPREFGQLAPYAAQAGS